MRLAILGFFASVSLLASCSSEPNDDDNQLVLKSLSTGYQGTCGLNVGDLVVCWGANSALGLPEVTDCNGSGLDCDPRPVVIPTGRRFRQVSTTGLIGHLCGITTQEELLCWGRMLVTYDIIAEISPLPLQFLAGESIREVSISGTHDCALTTAGEAFCWGDNDYNVRGTGAPVTHSYDFIPNAVAGGKTFQSLSLGGSFSCGTDPNGAALCWGNPQAVGDASAPIQTDECGLPATCVDEPVPVALGRLYKKISAGGQVTCGIDQLDEVYCWGLGLANPATAVEPVKVALSEPVVDISVGSNHACAVLSTGRIFCWGENVEGQLGYGAYSVLAPPTRVGGTTRFAAVSAGGTHTCALDVDGGVWCWGSNYLGELGTGDLNPRTRPTRVLTVVPAIPE